MPGVSVAQVALCYSMNANLVFKWLRDPRFAPGDEGGSEASFLPIEICQTIAIEGSMAALSAEHSTGRLRI